MERINYTVVAPDDSVEAILQFEYDDIGGYDGIPAAPVTIKLFGRSISVSRQQMAELGALFLALAGTEGIDYSSADELLDGYAIQGKEAATQLAEALSE